MNRKLLGILLLITIQTGCQKYGSVRVHSYWGTTIERPPPGTVYDWSTDSGHLDPGQDEHIARAVQDDVERELWIMGYVKRTTAPPPDVLVSVYFGRGLQPSPSGQEQRGTLSVRILSATDGRVIYCATADALIEPSLSPEERRSRIDYAVQQILLPLAPPKKGSSCSHRCKCAQ